MSDRPVDLLLDDMVERIERINRYVGGMSREAFLADSKTIDSVVRNLEVIGEAANRLPPEFCARHPEIPWRRIVGLRNRIVHEYFDVDIDLVWEIVSSELPTLRSQVTGLRRTLDDADG